MNETMTTLLGRNHAQADRAAARPTSMLRAESVPCSEFMVSGLVYDVHTGRADVVVEPTLLRADAA